MNHYTEHRLETHLEEKLTASGFNSGHYSRVDRRLCLMPDEFIAFVRDSQPKGYQKLVDAYGDQTDKKLTQRLSDEISKYGVVDVLRKGFKDHGVNLSTLFFKPNNALNPEHADLYQRNRFTLVRQFHYSSKSEESIDVVLLVNGIPVVTIELKNKFTGQTVADARKQYDKRDHRELIFQFKRCLAHFAVDNDLVFMSTWLEKKYWIPYNKGIANPINADGHRTHYLWEEILTPESLLDIIENFVMLVNEVSVKFDPNKGKVVEERKPVLIFPRYHQLDVIRGIRQAVHQDGVGRNFLVQHTTGAGKSYEIGWLAHLLSSFYRRATDEDRLFDSVIVLTDRRVLDKQLQDTINSLAQVPGVVYPVDKTSKQLKEYLEKGKSIIISTIQKFPVISGSIAELKHRNFAIIIDEVHSSQSGESQKHVKKALTKSEAEHQEDDDYSDFDATILQEITVRGKQSNISYFGFTGTPKGKTLELFGERRETSSSTGEKHITFHPFHTYTMKQSIAEGFTFDVLAYYTTYERFFKLHKVVEEDTEVPKNRAFRQLINFVDIQPWSIQEKVRIILEQFIQQTSKKIEGRGRAMVVTRSRLHCVKYMIEMRRQMKALELPFTCLCAFSGKVSDPDTGREYTEDSLNVLDGKTSIPYAFKDPRHRILIVANKFQTGFDEPMLHTMFVDKQLSGLQCVQTLSRLNRRMTGKNDTFILDFVNQWEDIQAAFQPYFQATYLEGETDPNRLYDLEREIKNFHLFTDADVEAFIRIFYDPTQPDEKGLPIIDQVIENYIAIDDPANKAAFKAKTQSYLRLYAFIGQIMTFQDVDLEKLYIFLKFVNKAIPKEQAVDISEILNAVDLDSFKIEKRWEGSITLDDSMVGVTGLSTGEGGLRKEEEKDLLSEIIQVLNDTYGANLTEENRAHLQHVDKRIEANEELIQSFAGNNTEEGRRFIFTKIMEQIFLSYVNDNFDFYKAVTQGDQRNFVTDALYENFRTKWRRGQIPVPDRLYDLNDPPGASTMAAE